MEYVKLLEERNEVLTERVSLLESAISNMIPLLPKWIEIQFVDNATKKIKYREYRFKLGSVCLYVIEHKGKKFTVFAHSLNNPRNIADDLCVKTSLEEAKKYVCDLFNIGPVL